jgi:CRP-like cAMP-binding protein
MLSRNAYVDHLKQIHFFERCSKKDLGLLARVTEQRTVPAGEDVVTEGDESGDFFVVVSGTATVQRHGADVATIGPGGHFGELSPLLHAPRNATVRAETDMELIVLRGRIFLDTMLEVPSLAVGVARALAERVSELDAETTH